MQFHPFSAGLGQLAFDETAWLLFQKLCKVSICALFMLDLEAALKTKSNLKLNKPLTNNIPEDLI